MSEMALPTLINLAPSQLVLIGDHLQLPSYTDLRKPPPNHTRRCGGRGLGLAPATPRQLGGAACCAAQAQAWVPPCAHVAGVRPCCHAPPLPACSLMQRAAELGLPAALLSEQYRMHPNLCAAISREFYGGRLVTAAATAARRAVPKPCRMVHVQGEERWHLGSGYDNTQEAFV